MKFNPSTLLALTALLSWQAPGAWAIEQEEKMGLRGGSNNGQDDKEETSESDHSKIRLLGDEEDMRTTGGELFHHDHPTPADKHLSTHENPNTQRVIVTYKEGCKSGTMNTMKIASAHRAPEEPEIEVDFDFEEVNAFVITGTDKEIAEVEADPDVLAVEVDERRFPMSIRGSNADISYLFEDTESRKLVQQRPYGVSMVEAPEMWARGATGQGVKVCVIDSGIDQDHPDFATANLDGVGPWFQDGCGHGTHVSGTIAGKDDNAGVIGVAPDAEIFTVRVFGNDCGFAFSSGVFQAARICRDNGADIISMSLGGPRGTTFENNVFNSIANDGVLLVAAAGNNGDSSFSFPASYPAVMSVAALNSAMQHAPFSQTNSQVDIAAPGVGVLSTFPVGGCAICGFNRIGFGAIDGTSMSTPHVSGVAALLKSAVPSASAADLRNAMEESALDLGAPGKDVAFGNGLVQADAAFRLLTDGGGDESSPECTDTPGWHDSDGETFDCEWYEQKSNCQVYGNAFENDGETANEACCACGGGTTTISGTQQEDGCSDSPSEWHDSESPEFDCAWYAEGNRCDQYGDSFENVGKTAKEACCACGGGSD